MFTSEAVVKKEEKPKGSKKRSKKQMKSTDLKDLIPGIDFVTYANPTEDT